MKTSEVQIRTSMRLIRTQEAPSFALDFSTKIVWMNLTRFFDLSQMTPYF